MSNAQPSVVVKSDSRLKRVGIYLAVLALVFLLGFIPMWFSARGTASERDIARRELRLNQFQNALASATIDARRGDYEPARQAASSFFTAVLAEIDKGDDSAFTPAQREGIKPLLGPRDELITLLARSDPAAVDRLAELYVAYRKTVGITPPLTPSPATSR